MREKVVNSADYIIKILSVLVSVYFVSSLVYRNIYICVSLDLLMYLMSAIVIVDYVMYAFDTYNWYDIFDREKTFPEVEVRRGVKGTTALTLNLPSEKQTFLMLLRADEKPDIRYEYPTELEAPVHEGQEDGQASYYINDEQVAAYPIYAAETVEKIDYGWCLRRCVTYFEREFQSMWQTWGV